MKNISQKNIIKYSKQLINAENRELNSSEFINKLKEIAFNHKAINHPIFEFLENNSSIEVKRNFFEIFAFNYEYYSRDFNTYLIRIIENTENKEFKKILKENLTEELGDQASSDYKKWPHRKLFDKFCSDLKVNTENYRLENKIFLTTKLWREYMMTNTSSKLPGVALGTICFGSELIVPTLYKKILNILRKGQSIISKEAEYFFELHCTMDVEHTQKIVEICKKLCDEPSFREGLLFSTNTSLEIRGYFWDVILAKIKKNS
tara:strand:+ start:2322 stop:3107 length:786 start_codon:yes stop_codon:yes gene_type:complete